MKITRTSPLTNITTTLDLPVTDEQMAEFALPPRQRRLIQDIFPALTPAQREFVKSGYTEEDWAKLFPPEEDE